MIEQVVRDPSQEYDFEVMAERCNISLTHFRRIFRRVTQHSPVHFLQKCRLDRAAQELATTQRPVKEIALDVGYCSISHFSRTFKRRFGVSPLQFRAQALVFRRFVDAATGRTSSCLPPDRSPWPSGCYQPRRQRLSDCRNGQEHTDKTHDLTT